MDAGGGGMEISAGAPLTQDTFVTVRRGQAQHFPGAREQSPCVDEPGVDGSRSRYIFVAPCLHDPFEAALDWRRVGLPRAACWHLGLLSLAAAMDARERSRRPPGRRPVRRAGLELTFTTDPRSRPARQSVAAFNASRHRLPGTGIIQVKAFDMGSGECIDEILAGTGSRT